VDRATVETIFRALNEAQVRYLIVGGLAVVAHGYVRFTADIDLVLAMDEKNIETAATVFDRLGYLPRPPVPIRKFADPKARESWIRDKKLIVFSLWHPAHPLSEVDLFVRCPFDSFDRALRDSVVVEIALGVKATVAGIDDIIRLKKEAGRPKDLDDIENLEAIKSLGKGGRTAGDD
jgi:predicted nucleotidyltransferase